MHFILDAVEQIPAGHWRVNHRGPGSEQYPPTMLLALLIYCYATGRLGSRTIEAATPSDVAGLYLCANHHPDHDSIRTFRREDKAAFEAAFVTGLPLAQQLRLTRLGTVSVDGTKLQANARKHTAVRYRRAGERITQLELEVKELTARAEAAEAKEAQAPLAIPAELARREQRVESLKHARQIIEAQAQERAAAKQAEPQAKVAARQAPRAAGKKPRGPEPKAPSAVPEPKAQYNFTDPESRIMKAGHGQHFAQAYNAPAAVDEAMLIVGQRVSVVPHDKQELAVTVQAISPVVFEAVRAVLADSGFYSAAAVLAVEQKSDGTPSGLTVYAAVGKQSHHPSVADLLPRPDPAALLENASAKEQMAHRLKTAPGQALYKLRQQTVEPVFGIIKAVLGFRRFLLRGWEKVSLEWLLVCVSYNCKRLFTLQQRAVAR